MKQQVKEGKFEALVYATMLAIAADVYGGREPQAQLCELIILHNHYIIYHTGLSKSHQQRLTSWWRTQPFALERLHDICRVVASTGRIERLLHRGSKQGIPPTGLSFLVTAMYVPHVCKFVLTCF